MNYNTTNTNPQGSSNFLKVAVVILGIALLGLGGYTYKNYKELNAQKNQLVDQKEQLINQLDELKIDYEQKMKENGELTDEMEEAKKRIDALIAEVKKQKNVTNSVVRKYRREIAKLKKQRDELYRVADSLRLANQQLTLEKDSLSTNLEKQREFTDTLLTKNEQLSKVVNRAKVLYPTNISATGVKIKSSGKVVETTRKWRTKQIRVCFTIPKNEILDAGKQVFFVRVVNPNGEVIGALNEIEVDGNLIKVSSAEEVIYENKALKVCSFVKPADLDKDIVKGDYLIEVYHNGVKVGTTHLGLK